MLDKIGVGFHLCYFSGPVEVPAVDFAWWADISTEAETKGQRRWRSARISGHLVPVARSAPASIDLSSRDHNRALLEQAFDNDMYQMKLGFF